MKNSVILTQSEFARCLNYTPQAIKNNIKRGQLQANEDNKMDITSPLNDAFIQKCKMNGRIFDLSRINMKGKASKIGAKQYPSPVSSVELSELQNLDKQKKIAEIERTESAARLNEFKLEKLHEKYIPKDAASQLINYIVNAIKARYENEVNSMLEIFKMRFDLTHEEYVDIKKDIAALLNDIHTEEIGTMMTNISDIARQVSEEMQTSGGGKVK